MVKHYLKSDGNGGFNVSKSIMIILGIINVLIIFIAMTVPSILGYGKLTEKVDNIDSYIETVEPQYDDIEHRVDEVDVTVAILEERMYSIDETLTDIKFDIKEIKNKLNN